MSRYYQQEGVSVAGVTARPSVIRYCPVRLSLSIDVYRRLKHRCRAVLLSSVCLFVCLFVCWRCCHWACSVVVQARQTATDIGLQNDSRPATR